MNHRTLKDFLKPNKPKILVTISFMLLNLLGYIFWMTWAHKLMPWGASCVGFECLFPVLLLQLAMFPQLLWLWVVDPIILTMPMFDQTSFLLMLLFTGTLWYLTSCLLSLVYGKIRKVPFKETSVLHIIII